MRRSDREVKEQAEILDILNACQVARLGLCDQGQPYIVPLNFGMDWPEGEAEMRVFFHCAKQGQKLDMLKKNPRVCVEWDCGHELMEADSACDFSYRYRSVIATGIAREVVDAGDKQYALSLIMRHQTGKDWEFRSEMMNAVSVIEVATVNITAKQRA